MSPHFVHYNTFFKKRKEKFVKYTSFGIRKKKSRKNEKRACKE